MIAEENSFDKPYISLKFGGIKSIDFTDNEKSLEIYNQHTDYTSETEIEVIKAYNGNFYFWWENRWGTKEEAINYIQDYPKNF